MARRSGAKPSPLVVHLAYVSAAAIVEVLWARVLTLIVGKYQTRLVGNDRPGGLRRLVVCRDPNALRGC